MPIERKDGAALWQQIAAEIRSEIAEGGLRPGTQLPTEAKLSQRFSVNRHTVRRAISALANDGYVEAERGRGTFVAARPIHYPIGARTRFSEIISAQSLQPGGRLIESETQKAEGVLAERLAIAEGTPVIRIEVLRVAEGRPLTVATLWFVASLVPNFIADYAETGSVTMALERAGHGGYKRKTSWISTAIADRIDCTHLHLEAGQPILIVDSLNVTETGTPLQYARARFSGDAMQLVVES